MTFALLKKDLRLLWPLVLVCALFSGLATLYEYIAFETGRNAALGGPQKHLLSILVFALLAVAVVRVDPPNSERDDFLIRPLPRARLVLTKLLFLVLFLNGPILLIDTALSLAYGFPLGAALAAAVARGLFLLALIELPMFAIATVARSTPQVVAMTVGYVFLVLAFVSTTGRWYGSSYGAFIANNASWLGILFPLVLAAVGGTVIALLQYGWRRTRLASALFVGLIVASGAAATPTWPAHFGITLGPSRDEPQAAKGFSVVFAPEAGPHVPRPEVYLSGEPYLFSPATRKIFAFIDTELRAQSVFLPLRASGLPRGWRYLNETTEVRFLEPEGRLIYRTFAQSRAPASRHNVNNTGSPLSTGADGAGLNMMLPHAMFDQLKDRQVRTQIRMILTLEKPGATLTLPAEGGAGFADGVGYCRSKSGPGHTLNCRVERSNPECLTATYKGEPSPSQALACRVQYWPYDLDDLELNPLRARWLSPVSAEDGRSGRPLPRSVDSQTQVVVQAWNRQLMIERRIEIPDLRLSDWHIPGNPLSDPF